MGSPSPLAVWPWYAGGPRAGCGYDLDLCGRSPACPQERQQEHPWQSFFSDLNEVLPANSTSGASHSASRPGRPEASPGIGVIDCGPSLAEVSKACASDEPVLVDSALVRTIEDEVGRFLARCINDDAESSLDSSAAIANLAKGGGAGAFEVPTPAAQQFVSSPSVSPEGGAAQGQAYEPPFQDDGTSGRSPSESMDGAFSTPPERWPSNETTAAANLASSLKAQGVTTVMIRNLPRTVMQTDVLRELDGNSKIAGGYDFCYLPTQFEPRVGLGYCFVNCCSSEALDELVRGWHRQHRFVVKSRQMALNVSAATVQGLEANVKSWEHQKRSRIRDPSLRPWIRPAAQAQLKACQRRAVQKLVDAVRVVSSMPERGSALQDGAARGSRGDGGSGSSVEFVCEDDGLMPKFYAPPGLLPPPRVEARLAAGASPPDLWRPEGAWSGQDSWLEGHNVRDVTTLGAPTGGPPTRPR